MATGNVVKVGKETTKGTLASSLTNIPCDFSAGLRQQLIKPEEWRSVQDEFFVALPGVQHEEWSAKGSVYYDTFAFWLLTTLGAPTTAAVGGDASAKDHTFKPADVPEALSLQWYQGVQGYQSLYAVGDELSLKWGGEEQFTYEVKGFAYPETEITAPTNTFSDVNPFAHWQAVVTLGGSNFEGLVTGEISFKRNRKPRFRSNGTRNPKGHEIGRRGGKVKLTIDFDSVAEYNNAKAALKRAFVVKFTDTATTIGSTSTNPSIEFTIPRLYWEAHEIDLGGDAPLLKLESDIFYDNTAAYALQAKLRNVTASY